VKDQARRTRLQQAAEQIDVPLTQATQAGHAFVYDALEERLDTARRRLAALFDDLANPGGVPRATPITASPGSGSTDPRWSGRSSPR
jgi:hypothetical protein